MDTALVIGGTRFVGRHTVTELLDHGYEVTLLNRGCHENPFAERVGHVAGDRTDREALERAARRTDPDVVVDVFAYHPDDVRTAVDVFDDVGAYVYVSSASAYGRSDVPLREGETPLCECAPEQERDETAGTYGPRKAESDRAVFAAAERGVNALSIRPGLVYGPYDYTERTDYWIDRVATYDQAVVPGDGASLLHRVYVSDVARAVRIVAERGVPGSAYNVGDRRAMTLQDSLERFADALDTEVDVVHASEHDLASVGLSPSDFVLYTPEPFLMETNRLAALGWESTPLDEAVARTVAEHLASDRDGHDHDPGREAERHLIETLES